MPSDLPANQCQLSCPAGPLGLNWLAGKSEGHRGISKSKAHWATFEKLKQIVRWLCIMFVRIFLLVTMSDYQDKKKKVLRNEMEQKF